ncbi:hypothetical protein [Variovorax sp. Sphag1AA]|uniref:hypothetical protein n=1 Tax=Variovorax sp. Sphag1AA TaxID=2587027 RepID=UPI00161AB83A|nr:hypothetical protein [Variovorax sp. Sphag1AA]MBB3180954.1 hypothetical protein [Variovorax sp. Sphag1AA]
MAEIGGLRLGQASDSDGRRQGDVASPKVIAGRQVDLPMCFRFANIRLAPAVQSQEMVCVREWRLVELRNGTVVLTGMRVGPCADLTTVRLSSPIVALDRERRVLRTESGRLYLLDSPPAWDDQSRQLLSAWLAARGQENAVDLTDAIWPERKGTE